MDTLCHPCDLFIGFGGAGVFELPKDKDLNWLASHCWGCGRSKEEVNNANKLRLEVLDAK